MDLEQKAIERIRLASDLSLKHYNKPLVCEYSGGKDSDVLLELFRMSGMKPKTEENKAHAGELGEMLKKGMTFQMPEDSEVEA